MKMNWLFGALCLTLILEGFGQKKASLELIGRASYYGDFFHGRRTASGERFDIKKFTAAHRTLPFGTMVKVTNLMNFKSVILKVNDRGPHVRSRIIDLSKAAAKAIDLMRYGAAKVSIEVLKGSHWIAGPSGIRGGKIEFQNSALYIPNNTYNYWGQQKQPSGFGFQVGVFTDLVSARELCQSLIFKGQNEVFIQVAAVGDGKIYRVMIRQYNSREIAEDELACLDDIGMKGFIRKY